LRTSKVRKLLWALYVTDRCVHLSHSFTTTSNCQVSSYSFAKARWSCHAMVIVLYHMYQYNINYITQMSIIMFYNIYNITLAAVFSIL
jgi:hypothetical protein